MKGARERLVTGLAIGDGVATGRARVIRDPRQIDQLKPGEILVTETTDPDWEPIMKMAAGDRHRPRRADVARGDRRARARHPGDRRRERRHDAAPRTAPRSPLSCAEGETGLRLRRSRCRSTSRRSTRRKLRRPRTQILLNVGQPGACAPAVAPAERGRRPRAHGVRVRGLGRRSPARAHSLRDAPRRDVQRRGRRDDRWLRGQDRGTSSTAFRRASARSRRPSILAR